MKIAVINGPNINMLGIREPELYGKTDYSALIDMIKEHCSRAGIELSLYQSNHEGALIDYIQSLYGAVDGIVFNPAGYTHTSVALADAVKAVGLPTVEVHITEPDSREPYRRISYVREACIATVSGHGVEGYLEAVDILASYLSKK